MNNKTGILESRKDAVLLTKNILEKRLFSQTLTRYKGPCRRRGLVKLAWEFVESVLVR
jgi:hypothetical protein